MATMTVSLPNPMKEWIEAHIGTGDYASSSDYVRDLVHRDRERKNKISACLPILTVVHTPMRPDLKLEDPT